VYQTFSMRIRHQPAPPVADQVHGVAVLQRCVPAVVGGEQVLGLDDGGQPALSPVTSTRGLVTTWVVSTRPANMARMVSTIASRSVMTGASAPQRDAAGPKSTSVELVERYAGET
jgi:hypothetical protein